MADDQKSPLDQALDLLVFAPMGLALTAKDELPSLVTKGRERVGNQFMVARMIGKFAVMQGQKEAEKAAARLAEQAGTLAARVGGFPGIVGPGAAVATPATQESAATSSGAASAAAVAGDAVAADRVRHAGVNGAANRAPSNGAAPNRTAPSGSVTNRSVTNGSVTNGSAARGVLHDDALAIPGYDSLSASQVVQRLAGLSATELEAVRAYEQTNRSRRTILSKVSQLQADRR
ncbi:MAG: hypothetical protein NVSMB4_09800 [Acidimicrobiales bacterium]